MRYLSWQLDEMSRSDHHLALRDERVERHRAGIKLQGRRLARIQRALPLLYLAAASPATTPSAVILHPANGGTRILA